VNTAGRVVVLVAAVGGLLVVGRVIGRVRRSGKFFEISDGAHAIVDSAGTYVRCESPAGAVLPHSACAGCGVWAELIHGCPQVDAGAALADDESTR
jgi:hypothetical protein